MTGKEIDMNVSRFNWIAARAMYEDALIEALICMRDVYSIPHTIKAQMRNII